MKGIQGTSNKTYRQLMGNGLRYEIPKFQRDYSWEAEHWDDLWQDIRALLADEDNEHYMGYLVLQTSNNKEFQIIDGQQRLTTMSLLILSKIAGWILESKFGSPQPIPILKSLLFYS